jgi:4'-phosphopantetheinyl transferase
MDEGWLVSPSRPRLAVGEVHVWRATLRQGESMLSESSALLSDDERERARRFHFQEDRDRYVAARAALRDILSRYLQTPPAAIKFRYSPHGKPALSDPHASDGLSFNLSHSHEVALYAVAGSRAVGIDVERVREGNEVEDIARHFFSPEEVSALNGLPGGRRASGFFDCWTRKEAYIKARGEGLSRPLNSFTVSFVEGEAATIVQTGADDGKGAEWSLFGLTPGADYAGALVVEGCVTRLSRWQWPGFDGVGVASHPRTPR